MKKRTVLIICDGREFNIETTLDTEEIVELISEYDSCLVADKFITLKKGVHVRADKITLVQEISNVPTKDNFGNSFENNKCGCNNSKNACGTVVKTNKDEIVTVMLDGKKLAEAVINAINNSTGKSNFKI